MLFTEFMARSFVGIALEAKTFTQPAKGELR